MSIDPQNHYPHHPPFFSLPLLPIQPVTQEPTLYFLSWGLRLLSDVASHLQRCSICYAVEEESEQLKGGWSIATSNGSHRTSIVKNPIYLELTAEYSYFCFDCFKQCFGATLVPSLPTDGPDFEEDSPGVNMQQGVVTEKVLQGNAMEEGVEDNQSGEHALKGNAMDEDAEDSQSGGNNSFVEAYIVTRNPSYSSPQELWSRKQFSSDTLVKMSKKYHNALKEVNVLKEECKEITSDEVVEMKTEVHAKETETTNDVKNVENVINYGKKKRKQSESLQGTRCSRINGRGWQCKKITLPGYALCEYHLGLARTRSMVSKFR